jgi:hypothetical protein
MSHTRRDFIKTVGATGIVLAGSDLIADLLAQTPPGRALESKFKGSDIAEEARRSAAATPTSASAIDQQRRQRDRRPRSPGGPDDPAAGFGGFGGRGGGRGGVFSGGGRGGGGGGRAAADPAARPARPVSASA